VGGQQYGCTYVYMYIPSLGFIYIWTFEALESKDTGAFHFHERDETVYLRHEHRPGDTRCS